MTYGKRLAQAIDAKKTTRRRLADYIGCSPQILGMVISGAGKTERKLSTDNHAKAVDFLRVSDKWLLNGEGEMFEISQSNQTLAQVHQAQAAINNVATLGQILEGLAEHLKAMDADTRRKAMLLISDLATDPDSHSEITAMIELSIRSRRKKAA